MRKIDLIVIHCSATRADRCYTERDLLTSSLHRSRSGADCHFFIRKNGDIKSIRPPETVGKYTEEADTGAIDICYEGGIDANGLPADTRTDFQKHSLRVLIMLLLKDYPGSRVRGDDNQDLCFDVAAIVKGIPPDNPAWR